MFDSDVSHLLSEEGPFAKLVPGFAARTQQQEMAVRVAEAIESGNHLIAEAGTGTGKTFAYLVPALMSQSKVLISTGTKNLQDQLFHKDLPIVTKDQDRPCRGRDQPAAAARQGCGVGGPRAEGRISPGSHSCSRSCTRSCTHARRDTRRRRLRSDRASGGRAPRSGCS